MSFCKYCGGEGKVGRVRCPVCRGGPSAPQGIQEVLGRALEANLEAAQALKRLINPSPETQRSCVPFAPARLAQIEALIRDLTYAKNAFQLTVDDISRSIDGAITAQGGEG